MFRRFIIIVNIFLIALSFGQTYNAGVTEEVAELDGYVPVGVRAAGMGGAHIALAQDWSAAYYNPALLSFVYKNEVSGGLSIRFGDVATSFNSGSSIESDISAVKLNNLSGVIAAKVKRGGMAMAVGYYRYQTFDRSAMFDGKRNDGIRVSADENIDGGLGAIYFAIGGQASKYVSFGGTIEGVMGAENYAWDACIFDFGDTAISDSVFSDNSTKDYAGFTGRFGLAIAPNKYFTWGAIIKFPTIYAIDQEWVTKTTVNYTNGDQTTDIGDDFIDDISITTPFRFGSGIAVKTAYVNIAADAIYTDWRQTGYHGPAEYVDKNPQIDDSYRKTLAFGAGLEFTIPVEFLPIRLRGGYRYEPLPYENVNVTNDKERQFFTGGIAFLIDKKFLLEGSAIYSNWSRNSITSSNNAVFEEYKITDIYIGMTYRF